MKGSSNNPARVRAKNAPAARRKEEAGSDSPEKLAERLPLFDITQDAIFLWRSPGGIEFWNRGAAELYGFNAAEAYGSDVHKLLQTEFPCPWEEIARQLQTTGSWEGELRQCTKDERALIVWSRFQLVPQDDEGLLVLESTRDVTKSKRHEDEAERRLREQAMAARFSLDALQAADVQTICDDAAYICAREMGVDYSGVFELSEDSQSLWLRSGVGWSRGHVGHERVPSNDETPSGRALQLNQPIFLENAAEDRQLRLPKFMRDENVTSILAVVVQGRERPFGTLVVYSRKARRFDGEDIHFLESMSTILATAVSRVRFERELRDMAGRLRGIVEMAVDGIITIDEKGTVETMNLAAEKIFGYGADEVVGRNISMLMPEPYRSEHDGYLERYRRTGERRIIGIGREVRGRRKDGSKFPMDLAVSTTQLGQRRIFTGLVRDITARKELEQEILEISDHEQRRIGSDLHDDLCQRLAGLRFSCDALRGKIAEMSADQVTEKLEKFGGELGEAIERTRMLARGLAPVSMESNGLASALQELVESVCKIFGVQCQFRADPDVVVRDPIAATHLYRIAQEAIHNALKHARASEIMVSLQKTGDRFVLKVEDNGRGFTPEEKPNTEGMGMRTVAYRAGMIEGHLRVESSPGRGTTVTCSFSCEL